MVRSVNFTVDEKLHVSPSAPQAAGVQGDDGATKVYFALPSDDKLSGFRRYDFYLEMVDAAGNYDISDKLTVGTDGKVGYALPAAWTQCGGLVQLRLVAKSGNEIAYTFAGQITVAKRTAAKLTLLPKFKEFVMTAIEKCKEAITASTGAAASAAASESNVLNYRTQAELAASSAGIYKDEAAASAELAEAKAADAYTAASAASDSASAAAGSEAAAAVSKQDAADAATGAAASATSAGASAAAADQSAANAAESATSAASDAASAATAAADSEAAAANAAAVAAVLNGKAWAKIAEETLEAEGSIVKAHTKSFNAFDLQISTLDVSAENLKTGTVVLWAYSKAAGVNKSVSVRLQNLSGSVASRTLRLRGKLENGVWEIVEYNKLKNWQETTAAVNTLANDSTELTDPLYQMSVGIYGSGFPAGTKYTLYVREVDEQ